MIFCHKFPDVGCWHLCRQFDRLSGNADRVNETSEKCLTYAHTVTHTYVFHIRAWISYWRDMWVRAFMRRHYAFLPFLLTQLRIAFKRTTIAIFVSSSVDGFLSRFEEEARWNTILDKVRVVTLYSRLETAFHGRQPRKNERKKQKKTEQTKIV